MSKLTEDQMEKIADALQGTCDTVEAVLEKMELEADVNDVEETVERLGIIRCPECGWWVELSETVGDDGDDIPCDSCR